MVLPELLIFILAGLFYLGAIVLQILVVVQVVPYQWVNGGRSDSYEVQAKQSGNSIVILALGLLYLFCVVMFPAFRKTIVFLILSSLLALLWIVGTFMQVLGTKFERYGVVWLNLLGALSHVEMVLLYFGDSE